MGLINTTLNLMRSGGPSDDRRPVSRCVPRDASPLVMHVARSCDRFLRHEMSTYAAALAYRGLLALFPLIIFIIAIVNSLDAWRLFDMLADWARTAPQERVPAAIKEWMVLQARGRADGTVLSVGALAALWGVASGARVLRRALNVAADIPEVRSPWIRLASSLIVAPILGAASLIALALFTVTRRVLLRVGGWFDLNSVLVEIWDWVRLPAGLLLAFLIAALVYRFAPSDRQAIGSVAPGAAFAACVWAGGSLIFSKAATGLLQFGFTYGSFSAAIVLVVYLYLAATGLLFGAELNATVRKRGH